MIDRYPGHGLLENRGQLTELSSRSDVRGTVSRVSCCDWQENEKNAAIIH